MKQKMLVLETCQLKGKKKIKITLFCPCFDRFILVSVTDFFFSDFKSLKKKPTCENETLTFDQGNRISA